VVVAEGLVDKSKHFLSDALSSRQIMVTIRQHLWLHNRHKAILKEKSFSINSRIPNMEYCSNIKRK
jgi:hypothetical protein